jgi:hypothetical protein
MQTIVNHRFQRVARLYAPASYVADKNLPQMCIESYLSVLPSTHSYSSMPVRSDDDSGWLTAPVYEQLQIFRIDQW